MAKWPYLFSELHKIIVNKITFVGYRGGDCPNRLPLIRPCVQAIKFSLVYCVAARVGALGEQRLRTSVLRYYCFNIVQQK